MRRWTVLFFCGSRVYGRAINDLRRGVGGRRQRDQCRWYMVMQPCSVKTRTDFVQRPAAVGQKNITYDLKNPFRANA